MITWRILTDFTNKRDVNEKDMKVSLKPLAAAAPPPPVTSPPPSDAVARPPSLKFFEPHHADAAFVSLESCRRCCYVLLESIFARFVARRNYWLAGIFGHSLAGIFVEPAALPESSMGRIEALGSDGNLRSCLSGQGGLGRYSESRSGRSGSRVKAFRRIRVGSWNVGSLTSKLLELVDALERHRVDIACFQETKWKGSSNKEVNGYKLWYSGSHTARNGVGVILRACLKDKVVHVNRCSDRIISLTLVIEGETVNVISAYAPQVGLSEEEKKAFWDSLDEVVRESPTDQRLILGGDLNGHIGATTEGYSGVHGGFGYGVRNEEGRSILDFATAHDLAVVNSYFKKRDHHLITFQSGGRCTQIDYLLVRRGDLKACKDCKVFPGEACSSQHRLLAMDTLFKRVQRRRVGSAAPRILWKNLNGDAAEAFRSRVSEGVSAQIEAISASDANSMWNFLASIIRDAAKDSLGEALGSSKTHTARRESWWLCEEVQSKVAEKQARFRELLSCQEGNLEERLRAQERYKLAKREAKKAIAQ
ncbi:craniofacial development protein 2, partial [Tanacetum coccineum]